MESGNIVHVYVDVEAIDDCVNSLGQNVSITVDGLDAEGRPAKLTGIIQRMELGEGPLPTHQTRVTLFRPPS